MCCFFITNLILIIMEPVPEDNRIWWVLGFVSFVSLYEVQAAYRKSLDYIYNTKCLFDLLCCRGFSRTGRKADTDVKGQEWAISSTHWLSYPDHHYLDIPTSLHSFIHCLPHALWFYPGVWCFSLKRANIQNLWRLEHIHRRMWRSTWRGENFSSMVFPWRKEAKFLSSESR